MQDYTLNLQEPRLKNHLGSRLNFKSSLFADRFVMTCSGSMLAVSGCHQPRKTASQNPPIPTPPKAPDPPGDPSATRQHRPHRPRPPDQRHGDPADNGPTSRPSPCTRGPSRSDPENPSGRHTLEILKCIEVRLDDLDAIWTYFEEFSWNALKYNLF